MNVTLEKLEARLRDVETELLTSLNRTRALSREKEELEVAITALRQEFNQTPEGGDSTG